MCRAVYVTAFSGIQHGVEWEVHIIHPVPTPGIILKDIIWRSYDTNLEQYLVVVFLGNALS